MIKLLCAALFLVAMLVELGIPTDKSGSEATERQLIEQADVIVIGRSLGGSSFWNDDGTLIYTTYRIVVHEHLKGLTEVDTVSVTVLGGTVDDVQLVAPDHARFGENEQALVYLKMQPSGAYSVYYGSAGKLTLTEGRIEHTGESIDSFRRRVVELTQEHNEEER